jgi:hypothetical protein
MSRTTQNILFLLAGLVILGIAVLSAWLTGSLRLYLYITVGVTVLSLFIGGVPLPIHSGPDEPTREQLADMETRHALIRTGTNITERQPKGSLRWLRPALLVGAPCMLGFAGLFIYGMAAGRL